MLTKLGTAWEAVRTSLWFVPGLMTACAVALAAAAVEVDKALLADRRADFYLAFGGGVEGARGVLSAIAGSIITVTGVVFSITIVALQLASSQFTPRVLRNFSSDRVNQVVLGVFIGTFTYTLLVLRTVRSAPADGQAFVPSIAVALAIGLALVSIGFLIFYVHHSARSIRASIVIDRAASDTLSLLEHLFPEQVGHSPPAQWTPGGAFTEEPSVIVSREAGYLQAVDGEALFDLAEQGRFTLRIEPRIGEFILPGSALTSIWPVPDSNDGVADAVRDAFVLGIERTLQQDFELGLRQLTDIAVRALSPGINDPTTATICVDRLAQILVVLGNRELPEQTRSGGDGREYLLAQRTTFDRAVSLSFDQVRHYGSGDPGVVAHLLTTLTKIMRLVPPERRTPLAEQVDAVYRAARRQLDEPLDLARIDREYAAGGRLVGAVRASSDQNS